MGKYPPPEIMVEVMEGFLEYFDSHGDKSLDEAFFETKHSKYKSLSFKQDYSLRYSAFDWFVWENEFESFDNAAEDFLIAADEDIDQDSFLRGYRKWKARKKSKRT